MLSQKILVSLLSNPKVSLVHPSLTSKSQQAHGGGGKGGQDRAHGTLLALSGPWGWEFFLESRPVWPRDLTLSQQRRRQAGCSLPPPQQWTHSSRRARAGQGAGGQHSRGPESRGGQAAEASPPERTPPDPWPSPVARAPLIPRTERGAGVRGSLPSQHRRLRPSCFGPFQRHGQPDNRLTKVFYFSKQNTGSFKGMKKFTLS